MNTSQNDIRLEVGRLPENDGAQSCIHLGEIF